MGRALSDAYLEIIKVPNWGYNPIYIKLVDAHLV